MTNATWRPNLAVLCPACKRHVTLDEHGVVTNQVPYENDQEERITFGTCPDCGGSMLLRHVAKLIWPDRPESSSRLWRDPVVLYPSDGANLDSSVPEKIANSYREAARCYGANSHTATAIMCRRTLEGICAHHGEKKGNLAANVKALRDKQVIDARLYEWADSVLRSLGNDAAHDVDQVITAEDARAALDFTKAIIEYLFVFTAAFERFKQRRTKHGGGQPEGAASPGGA